MILRAFLGPQAGRSSPLLCGVLPSPGSSQSLRRPSARKATFSQLSGRCTSSQGRADLAGQEDFQERIQLQHLLLGTRLGMQPLVAQLVELGEGLGGEVPEQVGDVQVSRSPPAGGPAFLQRVPRCHPGTGSAGGVREVLGGLTPSPKARSSHIYVGKRDRASQGQGSVVEGRFM